MLFWTLAILGFAYGQRVELFDPISRYEGRVIELPPPGFPVLQRDFNVPPDCGEGTYNGSGRLQGLNTLITGGDSGIGRATVIAFAREGANVAINYLPEEEADAQDLRDFLAQEDLSLTLLPGDLLNETFCTCLVEQTVEELGGLDILVGNAGYSALRNNGQPVGNFSTPEFERVFRTNVFSNFWLTAAAASYLPRGGSVVFTGSNIVQDPQYLTLDYGASKAALEHMMRSLAMMLAPQGIRVNAVAPALTLTPFLATQGILTEQIPLVTNSTPFGRILQPAEIAPLFVAVVDPQGTSVSGEVFTGAAAQ